MKKVALVMLLLLSAILSVACGALQEDEPVTLTLMSHDSFFVSEEILTRFTEDTGVMIELLPAGDAGNAVVVDRVFVGIAYIYHVRLDDGSTVHSLQAHNLDFAVGTRLYAGLRHGHKALCFAGEQRVV